MSVYNLGYEESIEDDWVLTTVVALITGLSFIYCFGR